MITELRDKLESSYMTYSMATIIDRALPDVRDGNFPIHRRILYAMKNAKITHNKEASKSSEPVSETMKIHHHGDSSIYESLALLTEENESLLHPFIDGKGSSFGKVYTGSSPAHMRYTFCRLNEFSEEMFCGFDKGIIDMIGDEEDHKQPIVLNPSYPSILVKPNQGIAVGKSCRFGSFRLSDVCNLTKEYIDNKDLKVVDYILPDFSTGAYMIYDENELNKIYETGKGSVILRSKYRYDKENNIIEIYEIPYGKTSKKICKELTEKMNTFKCITDVRDEIGFNKEKGKEELTIAIDVKKNTDIEDLMNKLYKCTSLQDTFSFNMNCLVNYVPKLLGIKEILDNWLEFKVEMINKSLKQSLMNKKTEVHKLEGLEKVLLNIDKVIEIIRFSEDELIIKNLIDEFGIDTIQAESVSNIKLRNINKNYIIKQLKGINDVRNEVAELELKVDNISEINKIIISDLDRVSNKYGKPRKTEILYEDNLKSISSTKQDLIEDYSVTICLTKLGYLKKNRKYSENQKLKEGDSVLSLSQFQNKDMLVFLTNKGRAINRPCDKISTNLPSELGLYQKSLFDLQDDEYIVKILSNNKQEDILIVTSEGKGLILNNKDFLSSNKTKQYIKLESEKFGDNYVVGIISIDNEFSIVDLQTEKKNVSIDLNKAQEKGVECYKGKLNRSGSFIYNCRSKKDRIVKIIK